MTTFTQPEAFLRPGDRKPKIKVSVVLDANVFHGEPDGWQGKVTAAADVLWPHLGRHVYIDVGEVFGECLITRMSANADDEKWTAEFVGEGPLYGWEQYIDQHK